MVKLSNIAIGCHRIVKGYGEGEALVSSDPICFYLADPKTGVVRERGHSLEGKSVASRVLVFPTGKASSAVQMDGLLKLMLNKTAPSAMIVTDVEPVLVSAAALLRIPLVDRLQKGPLGIIQSGDMVKVDATNALVTVVKANESMANR
jgi:predicted aconitase with swiveling domain